MLSEKPLLISEQVMLVVVGPITVILAIGAAFISSF
jgi:hypothetical protein